MARDQFAFLRQPLQVEVLETTVIINFNPESTATQDEAQRLAERATKRATEGSYDKAITLWKRVLELNPAQTKFRRDLAMAYMESGDLESAKNHLIEVLRLTPTDTWGWVVLGNLYAKDPKEWGTAEKFFRRAMSLTPEDAWALTGIATINAQRGQTEEAVRYFEQAITANPKLPNSYYGLGVTYDRGDKPDLAARALDRLFQSAAASDIRAKYVLDQARKLYGPVQEKLASQQHPEAFKAVHNFRAELESRSGFPVQVTEGVFRDKTTATIQMAWKYGRDHHLIKMREGLPESLHVHQLAHELSHLELEAAARQVNKNRSFATNPRTEQVSMQRLAGDIQKLQRKGYPAEAAKKLVLSLVHGLGSFFTIARWIWSLKRACASGCRCCQPRNFWRYGWEQGKRLSRSRILKFWR